MITGHGLAEYKKKIKMDDYLILTTMVLAVCKCVFWMSALPRSLLLCSIVHDTLYTVSCDILRIFLFLYDGEPLRDFARTFN